MSRGGRSALLAAAVVAVAAAAFVLLQPDGADDRPTAPAPAPDSARPVAATVRVVDGRADGGPARISARRGETVRLTVVSDRAGEVHVHGYDRVRALSPGRPATLAFRARLEGVFEVELHGSGAPVATLVVRP